MQILTPRDAGTLIRARRLAMGLSQDDLAERVGVSRFWVAQTERGNPGASLGLILRTLNVLEIALTTAEIAPDDKTQPPPVRGPDVNAVLTANLQR